MLQRLRAAADVVVGVHVRQGDYRTWRNGKYFFNPARYADWMREMAGLFPGRRAAFLICSDEPRNASEFPGITVELGAGSALADLCALAGCDYIIGPQSTYTQWASFYGNKPLLLLQSAADRLELDNFRVSFLDA